MKKQLKFKMLGNDKEKLLIVDRWWLSIGSDDDVCVLQLIYKHGGGSAAPAQRHSLEQWGHWKSVVLITAEAALRCLSLAAVSFWYRASSKLAAAL